MKHLIYAIQLLLLVALASPLFVFSQVAYPFYTSPVFAFQLSSALALIGYVILILNNPRYLPTRSLVFFALTVLFFVEAVLLISSETPYHSFLGLVERMGGVWNLFHYFIFVLVMSVMLREQRFKKASLIVIVSTALIVTINLFAVVKKTPYFSTVVHFGNKGYLANFLALQLPFLILAYRSFSEKYVRAVIIATAAIIGVGIFFIGSRTAFVAISAMLIFLLLAYRKEKKFRLFFLSTIAVALMLFGLAAANRDSDFVQRKPWLVKLTTWYLQDQSISTRLILGSTAKNVITEKPIVGFGRENFETVFERFHNPLFPFSNIKERWSDRAHNFIFDTLVAGGFLLLITYLFVYIILAREAIRERSILFELLLLTYGIEVLFTFDSHATLLPFYFAIGLHEATQDTLRQRPLLRKNTAQLACVALGLLILVGTVQWTLPSLRASHTMVQMTRAYPKNFALFSNYLERLQTIMRPTHPQFPQLLFIPAQVASETASTNINNPVLIPFERKLAESIRPALEQRPEISTSIRLRHMYGEMLLNNARRDPKQAATASSYWKKLSTQFPSRQYVAYRTAEADALAGNFDEAFKSLDMLNKVAPFSPEIHWLAGIVLEKSGKIDQAAAEYAEAIKRRIHFLNLTNQHIEVAKLLKKYPQYEAQFSRLRQDILKISPEFNSAL